MATFTPSTYQQKVFDFIEKGQGNAVINAVAGSGKTTTLMEAIKRIPTDQSILLLAFNKSIVGELKERTAFYDNVDVKTLHSLGFSVLNSLKPRKIKGDKYVAFFNSGLHNGDFGPMRPLDGDKMLTYKENVRDLINLVRVNKCGSKKDIEDVAFYHGLFLVDNEVNVVAHVVNWGWRKEDIVDFTDMLYWPVKKLGTLPKQYDWVFIDECQDLNTLQRELFLKCVKPEGRFLAVGDPRQAIYGFAGADASSFKKLTSLPNTVELPLSVCYRCDAGIVAKAKELVPQIEARDNAPEGTYNEDACIDDVAEGDMVLCRLTAPLVQLCMEYIADGVKANIMGRDIGISLARMLSSTKKYLVWEALEKLSDNVNKIRVKVAESTKCTRAEADNHSTVQQYKDRLRALDILSEGCNTVDEAIDRIEKIFSEEADGIILSTIHKSKGLEADRVFILAPDKLYDPRSMGIPWKAEQEQNLVYVAYTRAKHYLGLINYEI